MDANIAHMADVENAHGIANCKVFFHQPAGAVFGAGIFNGHVPSAKIHHLGPQAAMPRIYPGFTQGGCRSFVCLRQAGLGLRWARAPNFSRYHADFSRVNLRTCSVRGSWLQSDAWPTSLSACNRSEE